MFGTSMKLNEKNVISFASSDSPVDKEGYLSRKNDVKGYQRRWFVLKGNLLFSYEKKQDKEPSGLLVLESCSVQASATEKHGFEISYDGVGTRTYILIADHDEDMQAWMRVISHASYDFLKTIVSELQKQVDTITSSSQAKDEMRKSESKGRNEDKIPLLPKPKVKVENGILVDVVEAPPVPPKKRMFVKKSPSPEAERTSLERQLPINPHKPHSNPVIVPNITGGGGRLALSPPGTLDRTSVMLPTVSSVESSYDYDVPPHPVPSQVVLPHDHTHPFVNLPTTHMQSVVKGMAAPSGSHEDVIQLHQDFTEALLSLQSEKQT